jgi:hypothetical protein
MLKSYFLSWRNFMIDSKSSFNTHAKSIVVDIGGNHLHADPRQFKTGSSGFYTSGKATLTLANGEQVRCQVSCSVIAIKSGEWKD